ncbi:hypothetical protein EDD21DRAFT_92219 [Dissophora ornata]|nr:hypothetical protein EDD21DRAFT_92219 [Dissophora ornata]
MMKTARGRRQRQTSSSNRTQMRAGRIVATTTSATTRQEYQLNTEKQDLTTRRTTVAKIGRRMVDRLYHREHTCRCCCSYRMMLTVVMNIGAESAKELCWSMMDQRVERLYTRRDRSGHSRSHSHRQRLLRHHQQQCRQRQPQPQSQSQSQHGKSLVRHHGCDQHPCRRHRHRHQQQQQQQQIYDCYGREWKAISQERKQGRFVKEVFWWEEVCTPRQLFRISDDVSSIKDVWK